ncbi:imelysin family protein [Jiulongibacter sp. NS-SX5]|uniref:imelysin family protein n=1 Tax=Jiulongibacter sp. NS-SX5 TaxID=3463854 RepID=UPI0040599175
MKRLFSTFIFICFLVSCNTKPEEQGLKGQFDRDTFLQLYADEYIIAGFDQLLNDLNQLSIAQGSEDVKQLWKQAYLSFLSVSMYNFGPGGEQLKLKTFSQELGTFPVDVSTIDTKLTSGNFNFDDVQRDSRGLLAIQYLLFDENVAEAPLHGKYLNDCIQDAINKVQAIREEWDSYRPEFIANNGTDAGSSTSLLYNEFLKNFEALKNFKLGLPLGLRPGQTAALPQNIEALYSGNSLEFAERNFNALKEIWEGKSGFGFRDYLETVEGGEALIAATEAQIKAVENAFVNCSPEDFTPDKISENANLLSLHTELQKLTRYFKSDMSSIIGIAITYSSGDGD